MQKLLMLAASLSLVGCGLKDFPAFPDIKNQYFIDVACRDSNCTSPQVSCYKFKIISTYPYKIDEQHPEAVAWPECRGVGGFSLHDQQVILNYTDDVQRYFQNHTCSKNN